MRLLNIVSAQMLDDCVCLEITSHEKKKRISCQAAKKPRITSVTQCHNEELKKTKRLQAVRENHSDCFNSPAGPSETNVGFTICFNGSISCLTVTASTLSWLKQTIIYIGRHPTGLLRINNIIAKWTKVTYRSDEGSWRLQPNWGKIRKAMPTQNQKTDYGDLQPKSKVK